MAVASWVAVESNRDSERARVAGIRQLARAFYPCKVVDLGAGSGYIATRLKRDGADVVAVDWTSERVTGEAKPFFVQCDATGYKVNEFDLVVCAGLLYHLDIDQQLRMAKNWKGKPVILDTHFSRAPDVRIGEYAGQHREPSWSTKIKTPFVHTVPSLRKLFREHRLIETFTRTTADRQTMLLMPN